MATGHDEAHLQQVTEEYEALLHAIQSGVAGEMTFDSKSTEPKHLRVGVNSAMIETATLARLLVRKGIITELEYLEQLRDEMQAEVRKYEDRLTGLFGKPVRLS